MTEYTYEFLNDGHFGVNIHGVQISAKDMAYDSFEKFLFHLKSEATDSKNSNSKSERGSSVTSNTDGNRREGADKGGKSANPK